MNVILLTAAVTALVTFAVHTFVGTGHAVPALVAVEATIGKAAVWLNYLCWHIVSGMLFILAGCLFAVAFGLLHSDAAAPCGLIFGWISIWSVATAMKGGIAILRFPSSYLGGVTAVLTICGIAA